MDIDIDIELRHEDYGQRTDGPWKLSAHDSDPKKGKEKEKWAIHVVSLW